MYVDTHTFIEIIIIFVTRVVIILYRFSIWSGHFSVQSVSSYVIIKLLPSTRPVPYTRTYRPSVRRRRCLRPFSFNRIDLRPTSSKYLPHRQQPPTPVYRNRDAALPCLGVRGRIFGSPVISPWPAAVCVLGHGRLQLPTCAVSRPPCRPNRKSPSGVF